MKYTLGPEQLDSIEDVLQSDIMGLGVTCVVLIDLSGNIIAHLDTGRMQYAVYSLAALAAGNFSALSAMAELIGEEGFYLLFHKGKKESIHFSRVKDDFLLVTVFGKSVSLGSLRMKTAEAIKRIEEILKGHTVATVRPDSSEDAPDFRAKKDQAAGESPSEAAEDAL